MFMAVPGDRAGETLALSTGTSQNSGNPIPHLPIISTVSTDSSQVSDKDRDGYDDHSVGQSIPNICWHPDKSRVLLLCGGPDEREDSLANLFRACGMECTNYDLTNGPQFDIVDDSVWDALFTEASSME